MLYFDYNNLFICTLHICYFLNQARMKKFILLLCLLFATSIFAQTENSYNPFKGFHIGLTTQAELVSPAIFQSASGADYAPTAKPGFGFEGGLEFSYHFANYFGFSAGLDLGTVLVHRANLWSGVDRFLSNMSDYGYGFILPLKFEFHYPVGKNFWLMSDVGVRLIPGAFASSSMGWHAEILDCDGNHSFVGEYNSQYDYGCKKLFADLAFDMGFYYQLPYGDLLRASVGANLAFQNYAEGSYSLNQNNGQVQDQGTLTSRNSFANFQFSYIHTFKRYKSRRTTDPWRTELPRHEFQLNIGDPYRAIQCSNLGWDAMYGDRYFRPSADTWTQPLTDYSITRCTPTFSFAYHYRAAKWLWVGATNSITGFKTTFRDRLTDEIIDSKSEVLGTIMADLRFSYLNRKHVTLYSGLGLGVAFGSRGVFPIGQLTAFGVKAGGEHWFGNLELGIGSKGFISTGFGYQF